MFDPEGRGQVRTRDQDEDGTQTVEAPEPSAPSTTPSGPPAATDAGAPSVQGGAPTLGSTSNQGDAEGAESSTRRPEESAREQPSASEETSGERARLGPNLDGEQSPLIRYLGEEGSQSGHKVKETDAGEEVLDEEPCTVPEGYVIPLPDATVQQQRSEGDVGQCQDAAMSSAEEAGPCLSPDGPTLPEDSARRTAASPPLSGQSDEDAPSSTAQHAAAQRWFLEAPRTGVDEQSEQPPEGLNLEDMNAVLGSAVERLSTNYQQLQDPDSELSTRYPALHALLEAAAAASKAAKSGLVFLLILMTSMRTMCGGLGEAMAVNDTVRSLCNKVRPAIEQSNTSNAALSEFEPISYRSQVVAGTNYFVKIKVGPDAYAHARIFQSCSAAENSSSSSSCSSCHRGCGSTSWDEGVEAENEPASGNPYVQWFQFHMNNEAITRGFKFDRHFGSPSELDPLYVVELDNLAMCTQKTNFLNPLLKAKIIRLLRDFGNKKDVERYARYVMQRQRSRSSTELPRVLSSAFLPEKEEEKDKTRLDRITKGQHFQELKHTMPELFDPERSQEISELQRLSIAHAEDSRHRLYQQFYSPEAAVAYLAHRFSPAYAVNFRVLHEVMKRCPDFKPTSILDYGSGPAPSVCAAIDVWGQRLIKQVTCIEPSVHMKQMGKYMLSDFSANVEWSSQLYDSKNQRQSIITVSY
ncbi:Methyltransferase-like protein 17, mitochondrial, partial [Perkinsus olseni]